MGLVNAKVVSMGRYGRTKKIRLEISRGLIKDVFASDARFGPLLQYQPKALHKD
jgi:cell division control protein 6